MERHADTIAAVATATGGAISLIRISGSEALGIADAIFRSPKGLKISDRAGYSMLYGEIIDARGEAIDDVVVSIFRAPHSYTGEDSVEISFHGSRYIASRIMRSLIDAGARAADAGEFTTRAFLAGKIDLSQAEAVADMIASHDRATHAMASTQMRGGYSEELRGLRDRLLELASLLELELDFSEEDVAFADRGELLSLIETLNGRIEELISSFTLGNAIKEGVPVAIIGSPNAGKSTLLNSLLKEDRAMVSDIPGTTRDVIEERIGVGGVDFRFIDTAGIRASDDTLERMGIERTHRAVERAVVILYLFDVAAGISSNSIISEIKTLRIRDGQNLCIILNKCDEADCGDVERELREFGYSAISISAKYSRNLEAIEDFLESLIDVSPVYSGTTVVSNARHYEALRRSRDALKSALGGLCAGISSELVSQDIREALYCLGTITGEITTNEILGEIFSKFCIGK